MMKLACYTVLGLFVLIVFLIAGEMDEHHRNMQPGGLYAKQLEEAMKATIKRNLNR